METSDVFAAAFTMQLTAADILQLVMSALGFGAVVLFVLVVCGIYGLCRGERKPHGT